MNLVLEAKNINKHFLKPRDFSRAQGYFIVLKLGEFSVSIMGKSGSGKSTFTLHTIPLWITELLQVKLSKQYI